MNAKSKNETMAYQYRELEKQLDKNAKIDAENNEIQLSLQNVDTIYDKYSDVFEPQIDESIFSYLEKTVKYIPVDKSVIINVILPQNGSTNIPNLHEMIQETVQRKNIILNQKLQVNMKIFLILILFGLIAFLFEAFIAEYINIPMINELAIIVCWVFIWKAVETYFFSRRKIKNQKRKLMQLYLARLDSK